MGAVDRLGQLFAALWGIAIRFLGFWAGIWGWASFLLSLAPVFLFLILLGSTGTVIARNGSQAIVAWDFLSRCGINPFLDTFWRPIIDGIIRPVFNNLICWWDGFVWFPYGVLREVIWPSLRDCGLGTTVFSFLQFLNALFRATILEYIATGAFFTELINFDPVCTAWQTFWLNWQNMLCCSCMDLCVPLTQLPIIPSIIASDQIRDTQWWCFMGNTINGFMRLLQLFFQLARQIVYPTQPGQIRISFTPAFDLFCAAVECFWTSWENALQRAFNAYAPFQFNFTDFLSFIAKWQCNWLRMLELLLDMVSNYDLVLDHFTNRDSTYWVNTIKEQFKLIINSQTPATYFDPIVVTGLPGNETMEITTYRLDPTSQAKPNGMPNPLYQQKTVADCMCTTITRLFCDPLNNGTTCAQTYNGTLWEDFDFCCFTGNITQWNVDAASYMFEFTLHFQSAANFIVFLDRQPFTTFLKNSFVNASNCVYAIFLSVEEYGRCIQIVLTELTRFWACMLELAYRVGVALITLPYFETNLPGLDNFISAPGDQALNMALEFLTRLGDQTNPDGLINCLCSLLNTGFPVPPAGCTGGCVVGGFIPPNPAARQLDSGDPFLRIAKGSYGDRLNPILPVPGRMGNPYAWGPYYWSTTHDPLWGSIHVLGESGIAAKMDERVERLGREIQTCGKQDVWTRFRMSPNPRVPRLVTQPPTPLITCDPPPACFDLCCVFRTSIDFATFTTAATLRALNAAFQTQNGTGSPYWDGTGCASGPCLQSDLTMVIVKAVAPVRCICNFIQLVIPPVGVADPCCAITLAGELLSCLIQVVINVVNSVSSDPNFTYIRSPSGLLHDFDVLLDIARALFECACNFIRLIFGVVFDALNLEKNYDPCCMPQKIFRAILETARLVFQLLLSLATLEQESSQCYLYIRSAERPNCEISLNNLPIAVQFDRIRAVLLAPPSNPLVFSTCGAQLDPTLNDPDSEGIATCICYLLDAVLSQVFQPDPGQPPGCPIDICCGIYRAGIFVDQLLGFVSRLLASLWQNWEPRSAFAQGMPVGPFDIPIETIEFFFCNEYNDDPLGGPLGNPAFNPLTPVGIPNPDGTNAIDKSNSKCGRLEPVLAAANSLLAGCICSPAQRNGFGDVADNFLQWFFAFVSNQSVGNLFPISVLWPRCLCNGGPDRTGIIPPLVNVWIVGVRQIIILVRNINNPLYWQPAGGPLTNAGYTTNVLVDNIEDIRRTWIARFLAPFADALCRLITNAGCLLAMILGTTCDAPLFDLLSSLIRYVSEAFIRFVALIEGFVKMLAQQLPGQCVGRPEDTEGTAGQGQADSGDGTPQNACAPWGIIEVAYSNLTNSQSIGRIMVAILTFIADALIGIGRLGCSSICPTESFNEAVFPPTPVDNTCVCYQKTPYVGVRSVTCNLLLCMQLTGLAQCCPMNAAQCTIDEICGVADGTSSYENCPRVKQNLVPTLIFSTFFETCMNGARNMTESISYIPPGVATWEDAYGNQTNPNNYRWVPSTTIVDAMSVNICELVGPGPIPPNVENDARVSFGDDQFGDPKLQPLCRRSYCVSRGYCKNDQMVACSPGDPRGILNGILIAALKYFQCLLDLLFRINLNFLLDPILILLSIIWQLSGGVIQFWVATIMVLFNFLTRPPGVNFFLAIPDILGLFGIFFAIFTQPVVAAARFMYNMGASLWSQTTAKYENPATAAAEHGILQSFDYLFNVDMSGCMDEPLKCFCMHIQTNGSCFYNAADDILDPPDLTVAQVTMYMGNVFQGSTECDAMIQHCADMQPGLWSDVPYAERFEYVRCVAKRAQGERWSDLTGGVMPKEFFYSSDGWYKLGNSIVTTVTHHMHNAIQEERAAIKRKAAEFHKRYPAFDHGTYYRALYQRQQVAKQIFTSEGYIQEDSPVFTLVIYMDSVWSNWRSGYYSMLMEQAIYHVSRGDISPVFGTLEDNLRMASEGLLEISHGLRKARHEASRFLRAVPRWLDQTGHVATHLLYNGPRGFLRDPKGPVVVPPTPALLRVIKDGSWIPSLTTLSNPLRRIRVMDRVPISFRFPKLAFLDHWNGYGETQLYNWEFLQRMLANVFHLIWPHYTTREIHDRFILQGNCRVADGTVALATEIVDYCLNDFVANQPVTRYTELRDYLGQTSHLRDRSFFRTYHGKYQWKEGARGRMVPRVESQHYLGSGARLSATYRDVPAAMYRRASTSASGGSGGSGAPPSFTDWLIDFVGRIFGFEASQELQMFFESFEEWIQNTETDPMFYPNVGALYWVTWPFRCEWPESMNCSIGIGLKDALIRVGVIYVLSFFVIALAFPGLLLPLAVIFNPISFLLIVAAVAWNFPPACLVMWPSYTARPGLSIPLAPFPISTFAFPFCIWDEVSNVTDTIFSDCNDGYINQAWVDGPVCPACPQMIDIPSCRSIGMGDGFQNVLYWAYKAFGSGFCEFIIGFFGTTFGLIFSFVDPYLRANLSLYKSASPTEDIRLRDCSIITAPAVAWPVLTIILFGSLFAFLGIPLLGFLLEFRWLILASPAWDAIQGEGEATGYTEIPGEGLEGEQVEEQETFVGQWIHNWLVPSHSFHSSRI